MSIRMQARSLNGRMQQTELHYGAEVQTFSGIHAEMQFVCQKGFIDHESQTRQYLPCFHMMGRVTEVRGSFPYHVSSLFLDDSIPQDILYYPTPQELSHMIQTGGYYTPQFKLPNILTANIYKLPCMLDLTVIPPRDLDLYEKSILKDPSDYSHEERMNLPIFYVALMGTGVTRKTSKTLDYYGIEEDPLFPSYFLTAESSGYDPPLLNYIAAPDLPAPSQEDSVEYIHPEENADFLQSAAERMHAEAESRKKASVVSYTVPSPEDLLADQADRRIRKHLDSVFGSDVWSLDTRRRHDYEQRAAEILSDTLSDGSMVSDSPRAEPSDGKERDVSSDDTNLSDNAQSLESTGGDAADVHEQTVWNDAYTKNVSLDAARQQQAQAVEEESSDKKEPQDEQTEDFSENSSSEFSKQSRQTQKFQQKRDTARVQRTVREAARQQQEDSIQEQSEGGGMDFI